MALIVTADYVARRLGLPLPLSTADQFAVEEAITDAQSDVEAYLGRPITPVQYVETGLWPSPYGWLLANEPLVEIISTVAETDPDTGQPTGLFTVTYTAGLDALNDPELTPIRRWVVAAASNDPFVVALWRDTSSTAGRVITSLSAEGQSVSYSNTLPSGAAATGTTASGLPGAPPTLTSLDRWRVAGRRIYQRP